MENIESEKVCQKCKSKGSNNRFPLCCEHKYNFCFYCILMHWENQISKGDFDLTCLETTCTIAVTNEIVKRVFQNKSHYSQYCKKHNLTEILDLQIPKVSHSPDSKNTIKEKKDLNFAIYTKTSFENRR